MRELINDLTYVKNTLNNINELRSEKDKLSTTGFNRLKGAMISSRVVHTIKFFIPIYILGKLESPFNKFSARTSNNVYAATGGLFGLTAVDTHKIATSVYGILLVLTILFCLYKIIFGFDKYGANYPYFKDDPKISEIQSRINKIEREEYPKLEHIIARNYWNIATINILIDYLSNRRADSCKEAINLFESERLQSKQAENAYWRGYYSGSYKK